MLPVTEMCSRLQQITKAVLLLGITCWDTRAGLKAAHWVSVLYATP